MCTVRKIWENSNIMYSSSSPDITLRFDEPMANHTSFRVGGPADIFVEPSSVEQLLFIIEKATSLNIPVSLLGGGSNVLVSDRG
ncbi:MAG TPA: UDP-N-acetylenolpyruvoylglucosamine reductase, partial [Treponemataceae bacterium]|nr:UDP-N-acetylenolpyruvoylglucosamine reductase [Treponemataceae bacterium]